MKSNADLKFFAAELGANMPELDLHGEFPSDALERLELFLFDCHDRAEKMARIIYGGGAGVLRSAVLERLKKHPMVGDYRDMGGSCVIIF
ncbi:Smr/MutS family protein [Patescibacteria group bacterium]|nr:Smr/MutS family protein [Patescibacteria group bacterium]MBU1613457.1 Smr/MutS family protein [Patescibacteria group bacterium]